MRTYNRSELQNLARIAQRIKRRERCERIIARLVFPLTVVAFVVAMNWIF